MQRSSSKMLAMLLTLAVFFSTVAAGPIEKKSLALIELRYIQGAGIVLLFDSTGLTGNDLEGATAHVHSNSYDMSCNFKDESDVVRCIIPASLLRYGGETIRVQLAGFLFWAKLPVKPMVCEANESLWYAVRIYEDGQLIETDHIPAEIYPWLLDLISQSPQLEGITLEIVDRYCGPHVVIEPGA